MSFLVIPLTATLVCSAIFFGVTYLDSVPARDKQR